MTSQALAPQPCSLHPLSLGQGPYLQDVGVTTGILLSFLSAWEGGWVESGTQQTLFPSFLLYDLLNQ